MIHCCFFFMCAGNYAELHCLRLCGSSAVMCLAIFLKLFCRGIYFFLPLKSSMFISLLLWLTSIPTSNTEIEKIQHWTVTACSYSGTITVHLTCSLLERRTFASQASTVQSQLDQFRKKKHQGSSWIQVFLSLNLESLLCFKFIRKARYTSLVRLFRRVLWFNFGD